MRLVVNAAEPVALSHAVVAAFFCRGTRLNETQAFQLTPDWFYWLLSVFAGVQLLQFHPWPPVRQTAAGAQRGLTHRN